MTTVVEKDLNRHGALVAMESGTYGSGTPALVPATDGFHVYESPEVQIEYQHPGTRDGQAGNGAANLPPVAASGRKATVDLVHYFKGAGAAYTASVRSSVDRLLRAHGMSATLGGGAGTERIDYALIADGFAPIVAEIYNRKQRYNLRGAYVQKIVIAAESLGVPRWTFSLAGILNAPPVDAVVPAITYPGTALRNPKATAIALAFVAGGQTFASGRVRSYTLTLERELDERASQNEANGDHAGLHPGPWMAALEVLMEATAVVPGSPFVSSAAMDPYRLFEAGNGCSLSLVTGLTQYNRFGISGPNAALSAPPTEEREGSIALWNMNFGLHPSVEAGTDALQIRTD